MFIKLVFYVLSCGYMLGELARWLTMNYLTTVWGMNLTSAAAIINIWSGAIRLLYATLNHLADTILTESILYPFTIVAYTTGLGLLAMSTPPVLANRYGTCSDYKPECITQDQEHLFYAGLVLIGVGMAGNWSFSSRFFKNQLREGETLSAQVGCTNCHCYGDLRDLLVIFLAMCAVAGAIVVSYVNPWSIKYGIPAIYMLLGMLIYLSGVCCYGYVYDQTPRNSLLSVVIKVIVASTCKLFCTRPTNVNELYHKTHGNQRLLSHTSSLGCLDKAAIVSPKQPLEKQEKNRWILCSVTDVEETKTVIGMIPIWLTFIVIGIIYSLGNTYFMEQAKDLNPMVGKLRVPLPILLIFAKIGSGASWIHRLSRRFVPFVGIAISMVLTTLCCIAAAIVEEHRLDKVMTHHLAEGERIPMSIFALLPQYVLLGAVDQLFWLSVQRFFNDHPGLSSDSAELYMKRLTRCVFGVGIIGSVVSVYAVGKVSGRDGRMSWFQGSINQSRFDKYCWVLSTLSAVNLIIFMVIAYFHPYKGSADDDESGVEIDIEFDESWTPWGSYP